MEHIFSSPANTAIVMGCAIGCIIPVTIVGMICWASIKEKRDAIAFKQSLLDRGLSAEEIEQVINAGSED